MSISDGRSRNRHPVATSTLLSPPAYEFLKGWIDADEYIVRDRPDDGELGAGPPMPRRRTSLARSFALAAAGVYAVVAAILLTSGHTAPGLVTIGVTAAALMLAAKSNAL
jgi:hypothetical protein